MLKLVNFADDGIDDSQPSKPDYAAIEAERAEKEKKKAEDVAVLVAQNPHLIRAGKEHRSVIYAAKNIRIELKRAFPSVKFSVVIPHHSTINVKWTDGPTTKSVTKITDKYQEGSFDGMTDCYEYNHENRWPDAFGGARYVFERRNQTISGTRRAWELKGGNVADVPDDFLNGQRWQHPRGDEIFKTWSEATL